MAVMSKYSTSRRRSRYRMSPGVSGAIWCCVTGATFGCRGDCGSGGDGGRRGGGAVVLQLLEFAEADGLRHAVFGDR